MNNKPKAIIIGSKGMLGSELVRQAKTYTNWEVFTSDLSDGGIDITKEDQVAKYFNEIKPDVVINCAAYTDVEKCETDDRAFEIAKKVNGEAPGILAKYTVEHNATLVHVSTDYVFGDNNQNGYEEDYDSFRPLNRYSMTKLLGEEQVMKYFNEPANSGLLYIVRTSWLFGRGATNFIAKIIELSEKTDTLKVVTDEISCPTYVVDLAQRLIYIAEKKPESGIYHATGRGAASRYDFARKILQVLGKTNKLEPTTLDQFQRNAQIPNYSVLLNTKLPVMRKWEEMVEDYLRDNNQ